MDSEGFLWIPKGSYGFLRIFIGSYGFLRIPVGRVARADCRSA
jgi:hypothetical protein